MNEEEIMELRDIVQRNPGILERFSPVKKRIAEELLSQAKEVLDKPPGGKQRNATAAPSA